MSRRSRQQKPHTERSVGQLRAIFWGMSKMLRNASTTHCLRSGTRYRLRSLRIFCAYLLKILRNIALDRYRKKQRDKRGGGQYEAALDEIAEILPDKNRTEDTVEQREMLSAVTRFLETLPQKQRDLFVRRYWRFSTYEDLAHDYGMTVNHVKVTLSRIRQKLQKYMQKEGFM